ncbi:MAG TPA: hypothetical protein VFV99_19365 [Kofleriaceae bacterium]|nr:hypothetical protein [Kofleriaceae bacterium]
MPRVAGALALVSTGVHAGCVTISPAMRALVIALIVAAGCGGKRQVGPSGPPSTASAFPAARWVPGTPTYVFAARTLRDAQRAFADGIDTFGMPAGVDAEHVSAKLTQLLQVDLLNAEAMSSIGIDLDGGFALFSAEIDPTLVLHLSNPATLQAFIGKQRERGMVSQAVTIDGVEVNTAKVASDLSISWALDGDWLWAHATFAPHGDNSNWFAASKGAAAGAATWGAKWDAAQKLATKAGNLIGVFDLRAFTGKLAARIPDFAACARQFEPVNGIGIALEAEGHWVGGKLAVDVGGSAQTIASNTLMPPPGWNGAAARAPINAQWNLDLKTAANWVQPCMNGGPNLASVIDQFGVRSVRAFAHTLDPDDNSGTGAIALDLTHPRFFEQQLSQIPMRSKFERSRQYGAYKGKHLSVPFVATADYVLDDRVFLAAMGDGMLERAATGPGAANPRDVVFSIDLLPPGLSTDVWTWLFAQAELPNPKRLAVQLQSWADIHLNALLDGPTLVIQAQGNRR